MTKIKQKKIIVIFLVLLFLLVGQEMLLFKFDQKNSFIFKFQRKWPYSGTIKKGLEFYKPEKIENFKIDEFLLLREIKFHRNDIGLPDLTKKFDQDPFKRILNKNDFFTDLKFFHKDFSETSGQSINNSFYWLNKPYDSFLEFPYDDVSLKSLYCDVAGYDDYDFLALKALEKGDGGYQDTHFLLSLLFLKENGCYQKNLIDEQIKNAVNKILAAQENDLIFSDLYAERIVFLYWAGRGDAVKRQWIGRVKNNLLDEPGWKDKNGFFANPHTTGLALLSLIYYTEGKNVQAFYPHIKMPEQ